jgi:O-antigen ligase
MNAHNGFLSAWIGAGIPALGCLLMVYISTIVNLRRQNVLVRRICFSLLFMLFINSMTYSGIGGFFSMWYFVLAAVIVLSNLEKSETTRVVGISLTIGQLGKSALQG